MLADDLALMNLRAMTLFRHDTRERMQCCNDPDCRPAPRVFLGTTEAGWVMRFGAALPEAVVTELTALVARQPPVGTRSLPPALQARVRETLEAHGMVARVSGGPAYRFPASIHAPASAVQVTDANRAIIRDTFPWLYPELADWAPCFAVVVDGAAVAVCFSSRLSAQAAEAGVETLPDFRRRGFASAATAAWGAAIRATGRIPLYSTAWDNTASQGVAWRVGLIRFGADASWL
jgi:hypothetical protein